MTLFSSARDMPDFRPILHDTPTIDADMYIEPVHAYPFGRPELPCLPVLDRQKLTGVIFTRDFIECVSQQYVRVRLSEQPIVVGDAEIGAERAFNQRKTHGCSLSEAAASPYGETAARKRAGTIPIASLSRQCVEKMSLRRPCPG